ncbi:MAG: hypothetical protein A3G29_03060 [Burkholderiales bacterium RIFCSPLOWO2_12_FULL_64_99]|uniref:hypothetical protein n=1 Tax=Aquabacterium sp. TaxID=1872578 RepID=UPI0008CB75B5|nr:hypothetical protein [Aquabacterium sp.]OGB02864.1 MAG: hypothetical protein A3E52_11020 [Burkholderiales bacterium RIFCSPHIGHO2_12_FULL_63_20]OGB64467.1 MAG: hypothetical protein A3G29_03060 [Burkholderiales bacterium RIFCSPLOWO2_12_FULL_64_99]
MTLMKTAWAVAVATTLAATSLSAHADKKEVVQKILSSQQGALDDMSRNVAEQPARQLAMGARQILVQGVPEDKREATAKLVDAEIKKYLDGAIPAVRASAGKLSTSVLGPIYEEKFSEDELKQLQAMLESPVLKRYQSLLPEMSNALLEKVVADARPQVTPKLQTAEKNIRAILDKATGGKLSQGEGKPATKK